MPPAPSAPPPGHKGAALASLSVLQSATGVLAPIWGGEMFQRVSNNDQQQKAIAMHYAVLFLLVAWLLDTRSPHYYKHHKKRDGDEMVEGEDSAAVAESNGEARHGENGRAKEQVNGNKEATAASGESPPAQETRTSNELRQRGSSNKARTAKDE